MEDRQDDGAAIENDFLTAEAGPYIGFVACRPRVERCHDDANDDDGRDDGPAIRPREKKSMVS